MWCLSMKQIRNFSFPWTVRPLPIPDHIWHHITLDFIKGLPNSFGKQVIFVIVDRLSKALHFIPLSHPYTAKDVIQAFMDNIFKLHGFPLTLTSDRDKVLLSNFWLEFMAYQGVQVQLSSSHHPQTDGRQKLIIGLLKHTFTVCVQILHDSEANG